MKVFFHIRDRQEANTRKYFTLMLLAKRMAKALERAGVKVVGYEESKDPKFMDGEVTLENSLSVQVGFDYACLCRMKEDDIDYLLEVEEIKSEVDFANEVAKFILSS